MPRFRLPCGCLQYRGAFGINYSEQDELCNKHWIITETINILSIAGAEIKKEMEQEGGRDGS